MKSLSLPATTASQSMPHRISTSGCNSRCGTLRSSVSGDPSSATLSGRQSECSRSPDNRSQNSSHAQRGDLHAVVVQAHAQQDRSGASSFLSPTAVGQHQAEWSCSVLHSKMRLDLALQRFKLPLASCPSSCKAAGRLAKSAVVRNGCAHDHDGRVVRKDRRPCSDKTSSGNVSESGSMRGPGPTARNPAHLSRVKCQGSTPRSKTCRPRQHCPHQIKPAAAASNSVSGEENGWPGEQKGVIRRVR